MVRTQIQLTDKQAKALKELAASLDVSVAELIRRSVDDLLRASAAVDRDELKRRAIAAAGRFESGKTNVSVNHDAYLAGDFA